MLTVISRKRKGLVQPNLENDFVRQKYQHDGVVNILVSENY